MARSDAFDEVMLLEEANDSAWTNATGARAV